MANFNCKACGEPNEFETKEGLGKEQCVRCRSWNVGVMKEGALMSNVEMFSSDAPPAWIDGSAAACSGCKAVVPTPSAGAGAECSICGAQAF